MLGCEEVDSSVANPLKSGLSMPGRLAEWLQSSTAEVWLKFLLALVGLGLAFTAALFSTISRDAGNVWATVILASASLVLATLVGLVTVPYLARRVAVERLRESFDYDVTRAGIIYVLVTLVIGIAAVNTGNNLLYIVVAAMLAAIVVSGYVSALVLRYLELDIHLPEHVFAGRAGAWPHRFAESAADVAVVFDPPGLDAQETEKTGAAVAVGGDDLRISVQSSEGPTMATAARPAFETCDRDSTSTGNFPGHGLLSFSAATRRGNGRSGIEVRSPRPVSGK